MGMGIQMFLTVLIVPIALRAEPKLHLRAVHFRPAADGTFMLGDTRISSHVPLELLPPVNLFGIQMHHISGSKEKDHKI